MTPFTRRDVLASGLTALTPLVGVPVSGDVRSSRDSEDLSTRHSGSDLYRFEQFLKSLITSYRPVADSTPGSRPSAPVPLVYATARQRGWTQSEVDSHLEMVKRQGRVYLPCVNWISHTET